MIIKSFSFVPNIFIIFKHEAKLKETESTLANIDEIKLSQH